VSVLLSGVRGVLKNSYMKLTATKLNSKDKITPKKEFQQLQKDLESTATKLKKSKNKKDQLIAKFLASNYIHPQTGLITSKVKWSSRENSC